MDFVDFVAFSNDFGAGPPAAVDATFAELEADDLDLSFVDDPLTRSAS